jgi:hypothetical protein
VVPSRTSRAVVLAIAAGSALAATTVHATFQNPPLRATRGLGCAAPLPRAPVAADGRLDAQQRADRNLGTAYDRDDEVARRVAAALKADARLADTSIWVEARRQFVTLKGCVRKSEQRAAAEALARRTMGVLRVWNELRVVMGASSTPPVRPGPVDELD